MSYVETLKNYVLLARGFRSSEEVNKQLVTAIRAVLEENKLLSMADTTIENLNVELGEIKLVLEQQDITLHRCKEENERLQAEKLEWQDATGASTPAFAEEYQKRREARINAALEIHGGECDCGTDEPGTCIFCRMWEALRGETEVS
jgi:hypothetical protein